MSLFSNWIQSIKDRRNARRRTPVTPPIQPAPVTPGVVTQVVTPGTVSWNLVTCVPPDSADKNVLQVTFTDQMSLARTVHCMAVFETSSEYKLVAPWLESGRVLQKHSITEFQAVTVERTPDKLVA